MAEEPLRERAIISNPAAWRANTVGIPRFPEA